MIRKGEIPRKLIHLFNMIIPLGYLFLIPSKKVMLLILGSVSLAYFLIDFSRTRVGWIKWIFNICFNIMLRPQELKGKLTGATWVLIGSFLTVLLFPKEIAVIALLYMSIGDTVAALIGMQYGRIKLWNKTLEGSLSGLLACLIIALFYGYISVPVKVSGALTAMIVEVIPIPLDDNLLMPLSAGTIMVIISTVSI